MKVLIISPSEEMVQHLSQPLQERWARTNVVFELGTRGIEALERESPDIVILDTELPNAFALLKQIRAFSNVPLIALVDQDETKEKVRALEEGADHYVTKSPNGIELASKVNALLRRTLLDRP